MTKGLTRGRMKVVGGMDMFCVKKGRDGGNRSVVECDCEKEKPGKIDGEGRASE
jgi:hypothetical protein